MTSEDCDNLQASKKKVQQSTAELDEYAQDFKAMAMALRDAKMAAEAVVGAKARGRGRGRGRAGRGPPEDDRRLPEGELTQAALKALCPLVGTYGAVM